MPCTSCVIRSGSVLLLLLFLFADYTHSQDAGAEAPVLTVDDAVAMAIAANRTLKAQTFDVQSAHEQWLASKAKRYPALSSYVFASDLLTSVGFIIKEGQLGIYPNVGPIPYKNISLNTSSGSPSVYIVSKAAQPLTTLHKINLGVNGQKLSENLASEQLRGAEQSLAANVRQTYYSVIQLESSIAATNASIEQYEELDRITAEYVQEKTALQSDNLQAKAKLAQEQYTLVQLEDKLQTAKENLNDLLGRDLESPFRTTSVPELSPDEQDLKTAQARALAQHPQIRQADISVKQAQVQERLAKAQYVPDMSATVQYLSPFGIDFLPNNIVSVGVEFSWEPYDWGRRKHTVKQDAFIVQAAQQQASETRSQVLLNLNTQFRNVHEARIAVSVAEANRTAAQEKLREVTLQYQQKSVLLTEVLTQQAAVENAQSSYEQALSSYWTAQANYRKALGEE